MTTAEYATGALRRGLRAVRTHREDGTLSPELLTNSGIFQRNHRGVNTGALLLAAASILLAANAAAMGIVSWHAQYAFVFHVKHQHAASALEALGLDAGAVIFATLGIALAILGRRAGIERALVVACSAGSAGMNLLGANLGSPRSVAVYVIPSLLFAAGSDRLIAVIRRAALGKRDDDASQRSAWRAAGVAAIYLLRFVLAPPSTLTGARRAVLNAAPLPTGAAALVPAPELPAIEPALERPAIEPVRMAECPACHREVPVLVGQLALHDCGTSGPVPEPEDLDDDENQADDDRQRLREGTKAEMPPFVWLPPRPAAAVSPVVQIAPALPPLDSPLQGPPEPPQPPARGDRSKRARLIEAYEALAGGDPRYGDRSKVSPLAAELGPAVGLQPGSARTYLYRHLDEGNAR